MAKQRYAQFFRNSSIVTYQDYETAKNVIMSAFETNKANLKDGEFILGRYAFPNTGEEVDRKYGVVVGVARRNGDTVNLDFLADEVYVDYTISTNLGTLNTPASTVGTLATSASISTVTLYNVSQSNGKVSVGTTSDTLDIVMAGQYNASTNKVALESTVSDVMTELSQRIDNVAGNVVDGGHGVTVSTNTIGNSVISTVSIDLAEKAHAIGSTNYNTGVGNLLLIGSDGKLTIEDTWDCGTY